MTLPTFYAHLSQIGRHGPQSPHHEPTRLLLAFCWHYGFDFDAPAYIDLLVCYKSLAPVCVDSALLPVDAGIFIIQWELGYWDDPPPGTPTTLELSDTSNELPLWATLSPDRCLFFLGWELRSQAQARVIWYSHFVPSRSATTSSLGNKSSKEVIPDLFIL